LSRRERKQLAAVRGARRYATWVAIARARGWPDRIRVTRGDRPALLVSTSSALAVDAALEGLRLEEPILVEEAIDAAWARSDRGTHFVEIVVPIRRDRHLWQPRAQGGWDDVASR
jgi:hypothetical protein